MSSNEETKALVAQSYNAMGNAFHDWAKDKAPPRIIYTNEILSSLPANSTVLELGCGGGEPILTTILSSPKVSKVYANDISSTLLNLAKEKVGKNGEETVEFVEGDMLKLDFKEEELDAVVGWMSVFHLPREEQREMMGKISKWLKRGGLLGVNFSVFEEQGRVGSFFGKDMYWSGWGVQGTVKMVEAAGFEIVKNEVLETEVESKDDPDYGKKFLWIVAKKP